MDAGEFFDNRFEVLAPKFQVIKIGFGDHAARAPRLRTCMLRACTRRFAAEYCSRCVAADMKRRQDTIFLKGDQERASDGFDPAFVRANRVKSIGGAFTGIRRGEPPAESEGIIEAAHVQGIAENIRVLYFGQGITGLGKNRDAWKNRPV
jgi:hypothetical protein